MSISTASYFNRGSSGFGGATVGSFDKFEQGTVPKYSIGYQVRQADGTMYRYVHFGATVNRGVLVAGDISEMAVADTDNAIIAPASAVTTTDGTLGSYFIEVTIASINAGDFEGGKFITTDDTGEGYTYDILGNTATGNPASGNVRIQLAQPLQVAVDNTTDFSIVANKYHNLEIATTGTDPIVVGVSCATITAAGNYGWIQTRGICGVLQDAQAPTIGDTVQLSALTNGAVGILGGTVAGSLGDMNQQVIVGRCVDVGDSTGHSAIDLWLDA